MAPVSNSRWGRLPMIGLAVGWSVLNGQGAMQPFGNHLDDEQGAEGMQFIKSRWNNEPEGDVHAEMLGGFRH